MEEPKVPWPKNVDSVYDAFQKNIKPKESNFAVILIFIGHFYVAANGRISSAVYFGLNTFTASVQ